MPFQQQQPPASWSLWLWWVTTSVASGLLGITVLRLATGVTDWLLFGLVYGAAQAWCLRRCIPHRMGWIVASIIGGAIGVLANLWLLAFLPPTVPLFARNLLDGSIRGLSLGLAQWFILRLTLRQSGWWLPASAIAMALALPLAVQANQFWSSTISEQGDGIVAWGVFGLVYGSISGAALLALFRAAATPPAPSP
ncbi:MAG: hypothetical protein HC837_00475 [Chloroflexaceae bacterium]|nr:hypothetical protein [Chloroflexaceae bacterium]